MKRSSLLSSGVVMRLFDSALFSDCFRGFEELGELGDHAEPPEKAD